MASGDEHQPTPSTLTTDDILDIPNAASNTNFTTSSKLEVEFDPLFRYITEKYTHSSDLWHALNVYHEVKKRRRIMHEQSSSFPSTSESTRSSVLEVPLSSTCTPKPSFSIVDVDSLKISTRLVLPEEHEPSTVAGHIIGIDGDNYKADDVLNLMVLYTIEDNNFDPSPTSKFYAVLCPMTFVPTNMANKIKSQNTKWMMDWRMQKEWSHQPIKEIKTKLVENGKDDLVTIKTGPNPLMGKGKVFDLQFAESLSNGLIFFKSRGRKNEYKVITERPFLFSVPKLLASVYILADTGSSSFNMSSTHNRRNSQVVMNIASTKKYSLSKLIKNTQLYETLRKVTMDSKQTQILSCDKCLQYSLCGESFVNNNFGCIHDC